MGTRTSDMAPSSRLSARLVQILCLSLCGLHVAMAAECV